VAVAERVGCSHIIPLSGDVALIAEVPGVSAIPAAPQGSGDAVEWMRA
jgi:hypothetical protein